jgi:hypothetical protein
VLAQFQQQMEAARAQVDPETAHRAATTAPTERAGIAAGFELREACENYIKERLETPASSFTFNPLRTASLSSNTLEGAVLDDSRSRRPFACYLEKAGESWRVTAAHMEKW